MRIILAAAAALAVFTVAGCDINTGPAKDTKVGCNCATPPAATPTPTGEADTPPPPRHRWHRHGDRHVYGGGHGYAWRREYSEISVATYDYHSDSRSYVMGGGDYAGGGAAHGNGWVDGYGRAYGGGADHHETAADDRARLHPWHGYDADCPDNDPHARR